MVLFRAEYHQVYQYQIDQETIRHKERIMLRIEAVEADQDIKFCLIPNVILFDLDYLRVVNYYSDDEDEDKRASQDSQYSQSDVTQMSQSLSQNLSQLSDASPGVGRSKSVTVVSDNASDIRRAMRDLGGFQWLGCSGHNLNLVIKEGLKKNLPAAQLLKKCKSIIQLSHKSLPFMYSIKMFQQ